MPKNHWWQNKKVKHFAWIAWGIALSTAMLLPSNHIPRSKIFSFDKLLHLGVYAGYAVLLCNAFASKANTGKRTTKPLLYALTISIVQGAILEFLQQFVPGRSSDPYDLLANLAGAVLGLIVFVTFTQIKLATLKLIL